MKFEIAISRAVTAEQVAQLYSRAGLNRPVNDLPRVQRMLDNANLTVSAWEGDTLVGLARCLCDYGWVCYLSDLAVLQTSQHQGIGRAIVEATHAHIGPQCALLLLSVPTAMEYYPKVGFEKAENAFLIKRAQGV